MSNAQPTAGQQIAQGLSEFADALERGEDIDMTFKRYTMVNIVSLPDACLHVIKPILAKVEYLGDANYISSAPGIHCNMSGDTVREAIDNLKDVIVSSFELYDSMPAEKLGVGPTKALAAMRQYIERRANHEAVEADAGS